MTTTTAARATWGIRLFRAWFVVAGPAVLVFAVTLVSSLGERSEQQGRLHALIAEASTGTDQLNPYTTMLDLMDEQERAKRDPQAYVAGSTGAQRLQLLLERDRIARERAAPIDRLRNAIERSSSTAQEALIVILAFLAAPAALVGLMKLVTWIWTPSPKASGDRSDTKEAALIRRYWRWYWSIGGVLAVGLLGLSLSPAAFLQTAISTLVQLIGLGVVLWVGLKLRDWWSWRQPPR